MTSRSPLTRSIDEQLSILDELTARPFPEQGERPWDGTSWGGPGHHVAVLRESQDFWDDRSAETVDAAERELAADLAALAAVLTERWGSPATVDLWPYLGLDDPETAPEAAEPLAFLCNLAGSMQVWRPPSSELPSSELPSSELPSSDRWIALTIGQGDRELPFELLAAVGTATALPPH
ncbi:hypothetical protein P3T35_007048 [Kitasatospora sp. GP30]|uniref:hypothetical protein n=1 Tax=Kitasatospora sp. GP30 TaxID=3035084 RepID=UPI000C70749A|nr:hypothetical protein [Kitasatospora sp. GP30]MDH6144998.1 hypothetical protein [Kitasatospora sp. GP30]